MDLDDECCSATGWGHTMGPHGSNGKTQCMYCGESPKISSVILMDRESQTASSMTLEDAVKLACREPTLAAALAWIAVWTCGNMLPAAYEYLSGNHDSGPAGSGWDENFEKAFQRVLESYPMAHQSENMPG